MNRLLVFLWSMAALWSALSAQAQDIRNTELWLDTDGEHINAHGGCIIAVGDTFYWYGEHRIETRPGVSQDGVACYTSTDLLTWQNRGLVLTPSSDTTQILSLGDLMERPKVVFCKATGKYVMLFHHELRGKGYAAAKVGFAQADSPLGPFTVLRSIRPNAGHYPADFTPADTLAAVAAAQLDLKEWWTPRWREAVTAGRFVVYNKAGGQMSRDLTVFVDEDEKAYLLASSEENLTLHLSPLTDDYTNVTGEYYRIAPGGQNEAPVLIKRNGVYHLITSGCTGWAPNAARYFTATSLRGAWTSHGSPMRGEGADKTFGGQGCYAFPNPYDAGQYIFMADVWLPKTLSRSRHIWLPIAFEHDKAEIHWQAEWTLDVAPPPAE